MNYWLLKTEPSECSISSLEKSRTVRWDGVRNHRARRNLEMMRKGDLVLIHHSSIPEPAIVGIGKVITESTEDISQYDTASPYYDSRARKGEGPWLALDIGYVSTFQTPVLLAQIKRVRQFSKLELCIFPRLSVQSVPEDDFKEIVAMGSAGSQLGLPRFRDG